MVDLGYGLIAVLPRRTREQQRPANAVAIVEGRIRIKREYLLHRRIFRNAKSICPGWSYIYGHTINSEFTRLERRRRHRCGIRQRSAETLKFIVEEEERPVLDDRTTDRITELVAHIGILFLLVPAGIHRRIKPVARATESVPAAELVNSAVITIRAALGHHVHNRAGVAPVLGVEVVSDYAEFFGRI